MESQPYMNKRIELGYAITLTEELGDILTNVEPLVYGQLKQEIGDDQEKLVWVQMGALTAFTTMKKTMEYLKQVAVNNYIANMRPEDIN